MTRPAASIVVPTRGGAQRLPFLFDCLRRQTDASWEAIVVVDGDTDDTASLLETVRHELPVTPIVFPENRGRSAALNAGFAAARGDVFIRCDDDLRPGADYVAGHVAQHRDAREPIGVVGLPRNVFPDTPYARAYGISRDARARADAYASAADGRWHYWCGNVSTTAETYRRVGDYDTGFRAYGWEDVEWGYRLHRTGAPITLAPELEVDHHGAATTTVTRVQRAFHSGAARRAFDAKHPEAASTVAPRQRGLWNRAVYRAATGDLGTLTHRAQRADRRIGRLPHVLAEKYVSLLVEAAAVSGGQHPDGVTVDV